MSIVHLRAGETEQKDGTVEYLSESAAIRYASLAGFSVRHDGGKVDLVTARRDDIDHEFRLMEVPGKRMKWAWMEDR